jgi:hypothetical protein
MAIQWLEIEFNSISDASRSIIRWMWCLFDSYKNSISWKKIKNWVWMEIILLWGYEQIVRLPK